MPVQVRACILRGLASRYTRRYGLVSLAAALLWSQSSETLPPNSGQSRECETGRDLMQADSLRPQRICPGLKIEVGPGIEAKRTRTERR